MSFSSNRRDALDPSLPLPLADVAPRRALVLSFLPTSLAFGLHLLSAHAADVAVTSAPSLFPFTVDTLDNGLTLVTVPTGKSGTIAR